MAKQCEAYGGKAVERKDFKSGCSFIDCEIGQGRTSSVFTGQCPTDEEKSFFKLQCTSEGKLAVSKTDPLTSCEFIQCQESGTGQQQAACPLLGLDELEQKRTACDQQNGILAKKFGENGCATAVCVADVKSCEKPPAEAYTSCAEKGGKFFVKEKDGCVIFAECLGIQEEKTVVEPKENLSEVERLQVQLQLGDLESALIGVQSEIEGLENYKQSTQDTVGAERFSKAKKILESMTGVITKLREQISNDQVTKQELKEIILQLQSSKDSLRNLLLVLATGAPSVGTQPQGPIDCGSDKDCFGRALSSCHAASVIQNDSLGVFSANIKELNADGQCMVTLALEGKGDMTCKLANYANGLLDRTTFVQNCEGQLADELKKLGVENPRQTLDKPCEGGRAVADDKTGASYWVCPQRGRLAVSTQRPFNLTGFVVSVIQNWGR